ncbi:MAG: DUF3862 domain-containing protein [Bacillota bacterium]|nr:DUF3862 domain-containing protein [Bacillota bacterium]MDW7677385.1 DUF3862 domain-containing protein [Bacillota bacterium]
MKKALVYLLLPALLLLLTACNQPESTPVAESEPEQTAEAADAQPEPTEVAADSRLFSLDHYLQIVPGQSYQEVEAILGSPGENLVDNERLKSFQWTNGDGSMISVTFYDSEMVSKAQAHLGPLLEGGRRVTRSQFDQLKEGMTLEEVTAVLGPGTERVFTLSDGVEERIMGWENSDGSEISVTLTDNQVTRLSDLMLK